MRMGSVGRSFNRLEELFFPVSLKCERSNDNGNVIVVANWFAVLVIGKNTTIAV